MDPRGSRHGLLDCDTAFFSTRLSISTARADAGYFAWHIRSPPLLNELFTQIATSSSCYHGIRIQPPCICRKHPQNPSPLHCQNPSPILIHRHIDTQPRYFTRTPHRNKMHSNSRALEPYNPQTPSTHTNTATCSSARAPFLASLMSMDCSRSEGSGAVRWRRK